MTSCICATPRSYPIDVLNHSFGSNILFICSRDSANYSPQNSVQPTIHIHIPDSSVKMMPDKKERDLWWAFLAGRPESEWNPPKKPKQPKLSRWQQHHQKKAVREFGDEMRDMSLPYDAGDSALNGLQEFEIPIPTVAHTGTSADVGTPHNDSAIVHNISTIENTPELKDASTETGISYSPREPTPALLHNIDHVSPLSVDPKTAR